MPRWWLRETQIFVDTRVGEKAHQSETTINYSDQYYAAVVELVDTLDSKSDVQYGRAGSSPARGTI